MMRGECIVAGRSTQALGARVKDMASRSGKTVGLIIAAPLIAGLIVLLLPLIFLSFVGDFFGHLWCVGRLRASWPSGKFVLIAYTQSQLWAPYIERELLPRIGEHCVVVNRSRENWKREYAAERGALSFWGGYGLYNPIAVVLRPWGRVRVFHLYQPFQELKHGRASDLEAAVNDLVRCVRETASVRT